MSSNMLARRLLSRRLSRPVLLRESRKADRVSGYFIETSHWDCRRRAERR